MGGTPIKRIRLLERESSEYSALVDILSFFESSTEDYLFDTLNVDELSSFSRILREAYVKEFGILKYYNLEHLANEIFNPLEVNGDIRVYIKYHLYSCINTIERIIDYLKDPTDIRRKTGIDKILIKRDCLIGVLYDSLFLVSGDFLYASESRLEALYYQPTVFNAGSSYDCAELLFFSYDTIDSVSANIKNRYVPVFFIRQAIELRLRNAFGIKSCVDANTGSEVYLGMREFGYLIRKGPPEIVFPIDLTVLRKVYRWSNRFIHASIIPWSWQIYYSIEVLKPLFEWGSYQNTFSKYGAIKIAKRFYTSIDIYLSVSLQKPVRIIRTGEPEAIITD